MRVVGVRDPGVSWAILAMVGTCCQSIIPCKGVYAPLHLICKSNDSLKAILSIMVMEATNV